MDSDGSGLKLRQLQMLREVVRSGSMRLAARALRVSQPAISQNIKQLEAAIEFTLFRRDNSRLIPTEKAWELLRIVDAVFVGLDRVEKSIAALKGNDSHVIGIAAPGIFSLGVVPRAVKTIREIYPACSIQLKSGSYSEVADHVLTGRADLGISRLPLDDRIFEWTPVGMARNVCLFPPDHRFLSKQIITPEDLLGEALIDIEPQFSAHQMNVNALRYMGVKPDIAVEYDANGHDAGFVAAGVGISITNEIVAREYNHFGLEFRLFEPGAVYHYVVFWQKARSLSEGVRRAAEQMVVAFNAPESTTNGLATTA
ncbi:LysR family transcriptional regulator [Pararhizobium sp. A13]|uniref:LysR family transcriptional regulator n=1 Tax=Pararhizobium sp. A13 TaxID=3133975 RepID=UPI00311B3D67